MTLRRRSASLAGIAVLSVFAAAASPGRVEAADAKPPSAAELRSFIRTAVQDWKIPGAAVGIVRDGKVVFCEGFGRRDLEKALPVTPKTRFVLGSTTKAFTTAALGILVDEKKLEWETPVRAILPEFALRDETASRLATVKDLAVHRTGLPRHDFVWVNTPMDVPAVVRVLRHLEPSREFRTTFQYNNLMYLTLGEVVARASGTTWGKFIRERIFAPLGMKDSGCTIDDHLAASEYAISYGQRNGRLEAEPWPTAESPVMRGERASGSINTTAEDMCRWMLMHLNDGKAGDTQVVSTRTLRTMHAPQIPLPWVPVPPYEILAPAYGLGWTVDVLGGFYRVYHGGSTLQFNSHVVLLPQKKIGIVVLINTSTPGIEAIARGLCERLLGLPTKDWTAFFRSREAPAGAAPRRPRVEGTAPGHKLEDYAGTYSHPAYGEFKVETADGKLGGTLHGFRFPLQHWHYEQFLIPEGMLEGQMVTFRTAARGNVVSLSADFESSVAGIVFERRETTGQKIP